MTEQQSDAPNEQVAAIGRLTRLYSALRQVNQAIVTSQTQQELFEKVCHALVYQGQFCMAWIGWRDADSERLIPVAQAGDLDGYLGSIRVYCDERPEGMGPAGLAFRLGNPQVHNQLLTDPSLALWQQQLTQHQYRSMVALPIRRGGKVVGTLVVYARVENYFQSGEIELLAEAADDLSFALDNLEREQVRQQAQKKLTHELEFSDAVLNALPGLLYLIDDSGKFLRWNSSLERVTGYGKSEIETMSPFDFVPEEERKLLAERIEEVFRLGKADMEVTLICRDARRLPYHVSGFRTVLDGRPCLVGFGLDLTETRMVQEEKALAQTRIEQQAALIDQARDAIIVHDLEHRILSWSKGATQIFGWREDEVLGRKLDEVLQDDLEVFEAASQAVLEQEAWMGEVVKRTRSGERVNIDSRWTLLRDERGNPISILTLGTDITERKKIEAQFLRAQRLESIGTLAGGVAHDLNNILAPILLSANLLKMEEQDPEKVESLELIESCAQRGAELVKQVLSFARGVEGQRLPVRVSDLLIDVVKIIRETFPKNIEVLRSFDPDLWLVSGDPTQLQQVLLNLCVNARDAMPEGGRLTLRAENRMLDQQYCGLVAEAKAGPYLCILLEDNGTGISPEVVEKIFDPFFSTKEVGKGTGLGLSTSLAIVRSHSGFLRCQSQLGQGTRFEIYLPAQQVDYTRPDDPENIELPRGQGQLILVVDDELTVRQTTAQTLTAFGYRVLLAEDGADALSVYASQREEIALVLIDMMMPILDGPSVVRVLRRMNPILPIVAASGLGSQFEENKLIHAGLEHFLPKPYSVHLLLTTLSKALA
ncbi:PAS domain S-box protein [bacterium]|nr:PAS domain S-box protein [bacterium]